MALTRDFLAGLDLGNGTKLTSDAIDNIMAEHGKSITDFDSIKTERDTLKTQVDSYKNQLNDSKKQLTDLKKSAGDNEEFKKQIDDLTKANKDADKARKEAVDKVKLDSAISLNLLKSGAKNDVAVRALIDTDTIKLDDDGKVQGLKEQLENVKKDNPYLFNDDSGNGGQGGQGQGGQGGQGAHITPVNPKPQGGGGGNAHDLSKMTYQEVTEFAKNDPDGFAKASGEK
jgi:hypothetical protein